MILEPSINVPASEILYLQWLSQFACCQPPSGVVIASHVLIVGHSDAKAKIPKIT